MTKVIPILAGVGHCYLVIQNSRFFLVDSGQGGYEKKIIKAITSRGLNPSDLKFIFLTHTHYDHAGNTKVLKKLTGTKIIVHESETDYLSKGCHPLPEGTAPFFKLIILLGKINTKPRTIFNAVNPDITFDTTLDLEEFGFNAKIIHTPGHTLGSSSLIINKHAFVGDTMFNIMGKIFPPFANDTKQLISSWKTLLSHNPDFYYPAHGSRIKAQEFKKKMLKKYKL